MRALIQAKLKGVELEPLEEEEEPKVVDLMEALKRSLEGGGKSRKSSSDSATIHHLKPKPKAKAAKKKAAKRPAARRKRS
jgi:DNA end-binding protein Ku